MCECKPTLMQGPYSSPAVKVGDEITCSVRGTVEVRGWHDKGPIAVPLGGVRGSRWSIVVSHDLLRALPIETGVAICFYWALSEFTVLRWRRVLGIDGRATGGFLNAMSRVGSVTGRQPGVAEHLRALNATPWTTKELQLLLTHSTREVAFLTGRTVASVTHARSRYLVAQRRKRLRCGVCGHAWLPQQDRIPKRCPRPQCRQPLT